VTLPRSTSRGLLTAIGLISGAALAYEILLTRIFALVHWQHMVAIAIGLALLGYGASGTFVTLVGRSLKRHFTTAFVGNALFFAVSSLACVMLAQRLPFDPQSVAWQPQAVLGLAAGFLILALPFFAAANCVALALARDNASIPVVYGADLLGAGIGALALTAALAVLPLDWALIGVASLGIIAALTVAVSAHWPLTAVAALVGVLPVTLLLTGPLGIHPAPYKDLARSLSITGAERVLERSHVTGTVDVVDNHRVRLREAPGLSLNSTAALPHQLAVFVDGDAVGAIDKPGEESANSAYLAELLSAVPYHLLEAPRVLQLKAGLGRGAAQALQLGASRVVAVESNPQLGELVCSTFADADPRRCADARVDWHAGSARAFATASSRRFDLIHLHVASDNAGLDAIDIDFDLTVEAFARYLQRLTADGLLVIEGPTRLPPRQSMRYFATAARALRMSGVETPGAHLGLLRGWQRYLVIASAAPLTKQRLDRLRSLTAAGGFDLAWLPGLHPDETNRYQQLAAPYFYHGALAVLRPVGHPSGETYRTPATDDRPFPHRYSSWRTITTTLLNGEPGRLAGEDAALLVGGLVLLLASAISLVLILLPIGLLRWRDPGHSQRRRGLSGRISLYFALVGLAFLAVEIGWIQVLGLFLDHPVYATAIVLAGFLVFAGLGSLWAQRFAPGDERRLLFGAVTAIIISGGIYLLWLADLLEHWAALPFAIRVVVAFVLLAPLAFAMGVPFPIGLRHFGAEAPELIPWAWGINGCASVISAVGAPLLALSIGFGGLMGTALSAYAALPFLLSRVADRRDPAATQ